jgi:hypothetical protein
MPRTALWSIGVCRLCCKHQFLNYKPYCLTVVYSKSFATLEQIRLQTEYQAVVTKSDAKEQAEYLRELATKARSRKALLSQSDSDSQDWQQYQKIVKSAEPCLLCIISDVSQLLHG